MVANIVIGIRNRLAHLFARRVLRVRDLEEFVFRAADCQELTVELIWSDFSPNMGSESSPALTMYRSYHTILTASFSDSEERPRIVCKHLLVARWLEFSPKANILEITAEAKKKAADLVFNLSKAFPGAKFNFIDVDDPFSTDPEAA